MKPNGPRKIRLSENHQKNRLCGVAVGRHGSQFGGHAAAISVWRDSGHALHHREGRFDLFVTIGLRAICWLLTLSSASGPFKESSCKAPDSAMANELILDDCLAFRS